MRVKLQLTRLLATTALLACAVAGTSLLAVTAAAYPGQPRELVVFINPAEQIITEFPETDVTDLDFVYEQDGFCRFDLRRDLFLELGSQRYQLIFVVFQLRGSQDCSAAGQGLPLAMAKFREQSTANEIDFYTRIHRQDFRRFDLYVSVNDYGFSGEIRSRY